MPIIKRTEDKRKRSIEDYRTVAETCETYDEFRIAVWDMQDNEGVNFRNSTRDGRPISNEIIFGPKLLEPFDDIFIAANADLSRQMLALICQFEQVVELKWDRKWTRVGAAGKITYPLPDQPVASKR